MRNCRYLFQRCGGCFCRLWSDPDCLLHLRGRRQVENPQLKYFSCAIAAICFRDAAAAFVVFDLTRIACCTLEAGAKWKIHNSNIFHAQLPLFVSEMRRLLLSSLIWPGLPPLRPRPSGKSTWTSRFVLIDFKMIYPRDPPKNYSILPLCFCS